MFELKRKYLDDSLEPLAFLWLTRYYPLIVFNNYVGFHRLRNLMSPIGINHFIIGYSVILLAGVLQEVLIGDPAARRFMLMMLATHVLYDALLNMAILRLGMRSETEHYTAELIIHEDPLTLPQRLEQLQQQGRQQAFTQVARSTRAHGQKIDRLRWLGGIRICEKGAGSCWVIRLMDGEDFESWIACPNQDEHYSYILPVFQEVRDRQLSPKRRQQVLRRLARKGIYLQAGSCQSPVTVSSNS